MAAVSQAPVIVYFDAENSFQLYSGGIYNGGAGSDCSSGNINHAIVVVGYQWTGTSSTSYWIVKNSWSTGWGQAGYILIGMTGDGIGPCGK